MPAFLIALLPEMTLLFASVGALFVGLFSPAKKARQWVSQCIQTAFVLCFLMLCLFDFTPENSFELSFVLNDFALWGKRFVLMAGFLSIVFANDWLNYKNYSRFEYPILVAFSVLGMMITLGANDFLIQFLGLEMMFLPLLFLLSYKRQGKKTTQTASKYVLIHFLSSGLYLFGISVLYASFGKIDFSPLIIKENPDLQMVLLWGLCFILTGLFLKLFVVPFHSFMAYFYEGQPTPVVSMFALACRIPLFVVLFRLRAETFQGIEFFWRPLLMLLSFASVFWGGFRAVSQTNLKRLLAYTVLVFNGFALSTFIVQNPSLLLLFLFVDGVVLTGLIAILLSLRVSGDLREEIKALFGQGQVKPVRGVVFSFIFLGLSGMAPFGSFWSKFFLFQDVTDAFLNAFLVFLMLAGVLLMYVYMKLVRQLYVAEPQEEIEPASKAMKIVLVFCALFSALLMIFIAPLSGLIQLG